MNGIYYCTSEYNGTQLPTIQLACTYIEKGAWSGTWLSIERNQIAQHILQNELFKRRVVMVWCDSRYGRTLIDAMRLSIHFAEVHFPAHAQWTRELPAMDVWKWITRHCPKPPEIQR